jgi:hypothetical protein
MLSRNPSKSEHKKIAESQLVSAKAHLDGSDKLKPTKNSNIMRLEAIQLAAQAMQNFEFAGMKSSAQAKECLAIIEKCASQMINGVDWAIIGTDRQLKEDAEYEADRLVWTTVDHIKDITTTQSLYRKKFAIAKKITQQDISNYTGDKEKLLDNIEKAIKIYSKNGIDSEASKTASDLRKKLSNADFDDHLTATKHLGVRKNPTDAARRAAIKKLDDHNTSRSKSMANSKASEAVKLYKSKESKRALSKVNEAIKLYDVLGMKNSEERHAASDLKTSIMMQIKRS